MGLYILPSIFAVSAKIAVLILGRRALKFVDKSLLLFLIGLFGVNVFELALLLSLPHPEKTFFLLILYYNSVIVANGACVYYMLGLKGWRTRNIGHFIIAVHVLALIATSIPGVVLDGAEAISYSITRVPGPLYPFLQLLVFTGLGVTAVTLVAAQKDRRSQTRKKALVLLIAMSPLLLTVATVMILMQFGYALNATIAVSLATSFMMAVLMFTESKYRLFKFLSIIPNTEENKQWSALSEILNKPNMSLKEAQNMFTAMFVEEAVKRSEGNQVKAAKALNTSRTTVYRYLKDGREEKE